MRFDVASAKRSSGRSGIATLSVARAVPALLMTCVFTLLLLMVALLPHSARAFTNNGPGDENNNAGPVQVTQTFVPPDVVTPIPTSQVPRWENLALSDLADELGWPPVVGDDGARLSISLTITTTEQAEISIRPFDFSAGAAAAFAAEQQDARLAGLQVSPGRFASYPSYTAELNYNGASYERRLHWVVDSWIFAVDIVGTGSVMQALDMPDLASRLWQSAIQHGLPAWAGATSTPVPTHGQAPSATPTVGSCGVSFSDVSSDYWAFRYITELACSGVIGGYSDGTFRPQNSTTRAQLAKMIVLTQGWALANPARPTFRDVDGSHLFYRYVETAYAHGVINGFGGGLFKPDAYVTRAQVAKMLVRSRGWTLEGQTSVALCDVPVSHWAWTFIQIAIQHNVFTGYANGCFYPDAYATRAQIAKVVVQTGH